MIEVDGSLMEGGGQLLRMATTYSAILGEPVRITKIRANRNQPGLKPQHFTTLKAVAELCSAETKGLEVGSGEIEFRPGRIRGGVFDFDIGTAGSCSLLLQCAAPVAAYADGPVKITVKGGTAVRWSPPDVHRSKRCLDRPQGIGLLGGRQDSPGRLLPEGGRPR